MKWPPNKTWTSTITKKGFRHFEVMSYGGRKSQRWVSLFAVMNKKIRIKILWKELKKSSNWRSGWLQIINEEVIQND